VLTGAVVLDSVAADELLADGDLDGVTDDGGRRFHGHAVA
jgi:hypothetical protein